MSEASTWDGLAGRYDRVVRLFDRSYPAIRDRLRVDLVGRRRVLEVAAGTGQFTPDLAAVCEELVATDVSPEMVRLLGDRLGVQGIDGVSVAVMGAYALDAEDGAFDAVFCANALHVMEEPRRALAEFHRVLGPGGVLVAPTFLHGAGPARRALSCGLSAVSSFVAHTRWDLAGLVDFIGRSGFDVQRAEALPGLFPVGYVTASTIDRV